jgi:class 3 adenylate cyclase/tetratricopeptide (TPR) repeat protein
MSQLDSRLTPSLRAEWKLFDLVNSSSIEYLALCEKMISVGEFLLAHDVAKAGLKKHKNDRQLCQRAAHALSKAGSPKMASKLLEELVAGGDRGVETHSLLASAYKDLWEQSTDSDSKKKYAELAIARYAEGFSTNSFDNLRTSQRADLETQYYPCINISFMYFFSGEYESGKEYAEKAWKICEKLKASGKHDYWIQATEAEALLLLGSVDDAVFAYGEAVAMPDAKPSRVSSTRKQALQIAAAYEDGEISQKIQNAFPTLGIVAFSGHVLDQPGSNRRFPPEAEEIAKKEIAAALDEMGASCGYSSAACGTDILFLEIMIERGAETHIFLPFAKEEFIETSVRRAGGNWVSRFEAVLDQATSIHYVTKDGYNCEDTLYTFCNDVLLGFAAMRGRGMDENPRLLVFWDGQPGAEGGTGELVKKWRKNFNEPVIIDAKEVLEAIPEVTELPAHGGETKPAFLIKDDPVQALPRTIKTMLFADVEGFSRLDESMTPQFVEKFLGGISEIIERLSSAPAFVNTWGDSFFAVFDKLEDGLKLALELRDYFSKGDWSELGLMKGMEVRISMHAGPAYEKFDPILGKLNFFGNHVNQAARIEPIVLPGSVFVSETVAALLSFGHEGFDFEYVGHLELAKNFGSYPIYILQRTGYRYEG